MKWKPGKRSKDVEDHTGSGGGGGGGDAGGGGGGGINIPGGGGGGTRGGGLPIPMPKGKGGILTFVIIIVIYLVLNGFKCPGAGGGGAGTDINVDDELNPFPDVPAEEKQEGPGAPDPQDKTKQFMSFVLDDVQNFWAAEFKAGGKEYQRAKLNLFTAQIDSGCGAASSATGPFYCPLDQEAYLDVTFFQQLAKDFEAPGDFPQAYVLAHEIGHHVQTLLGISQKVQEESQTNPDDANELSVRLELQADCLAGVWTRSTYERGILEEGDLDEGINAASQIGDDRIQEKTQGRIDPESFTHGSAEQRARWLQKGYDEGKLEACDTFSGDI